MVCFAGKKKGEAVPGVWSGFESGKPLLVFLSLRHNPVLSPVPFSAVTTCGQTQSQLTRGNSSPLSQCRYLCRTVFILGSCT